MSLAAYATRRTSFTPRREAGRMVGGRGAPTGRNSSRKIGKTAGQSTDYRSRPLYQTDPANSVVFRADFAPLSATPTRTRNRSHHTGPDEGSRAGHDRRLRGTATGSPRWGRRPTIGERAVAHRDELRVRGDVGAHDLVPRACRACASASARGSPSSALTFANASDDRDRLVTRVASLGHAAS